MVVRIIGMRSWALRTAWQLFDGIPQEAEHLNQGGPTAVDTLELRVHSCRTNQNQHTMVQNEGDVSVVSWIEYRQCRAFPGHTVKTLQQMEK